MKHAHLIVLMILSAFCYLTGLCMAGVVYTVIPPLQQQYWLIAIQAVLWQEAARYGFFRACIKAELGMQAISSQKLFSPRNFLSVLAAGLGFGISYVLVMHGAVLSLAWGPATKYVPACDNLSLFFMTSINCLCFMLMHVSWSIIAISGFLKMDKRKIAFVIVSHLLASLITTGNTTENGCNGTVPVLMLLTAVVVFAAVRNAYLEAQTSASLSGGDHAMHRQ